MLSTRNFDQAFEEKTGSRTGQLGEHTHLTPSLVERKHLRRTVPVPLECGVAQSSRPERAVL